LVAQQRWHDEDHEDAEAQAQPHQRPQALEAAEHQHDDREAPHQPQQRHLPLEVLERVLELRGRRPHEAQDHLVAVGQGGHLELRGLDRERHVVAAVGPRRQVGRVDRARLVAGHLDARARPLLGPGDGAVHERPGLGADVGRVALGPHHHQAQHRDGADERDQDGQPGTGPVGWLVGGIDEGIVRTGTPNGVGGRDTHRPATLTLGAEVVARRRRPAGGPTRGIGGR
jgi:hypothetical protein